MAWLWIGLILFAAFAPIMWFMPSRQDRLLSAMRTRARVVGLAVRLDTIADPDPAPEDRVTAGGKVREPTRDCVAYTRALHRPGRSSQVEPWQRVRRRDAADPAGWLASTGTAPDTLDPAALAAAIAASGAQVLGLGGDASSVTCWWIERGGPAQVDGVAALLDVLAAQQQAAIDRLG